MSKLEETSRIQRSKDVVSRIIDDETILVLTKQGQVKVVNEIGGYIWELVENTPTFSEIISSIVAEYEVDEDKAIDDVQNYILKLADLGALVIL